MSIVTFGHTVLLQQRLGPLAGSKGYFGKMKVFGINFKQNKGFFLAPFPISVPEIPALRPIL